MSSPWSYGTCMQQVLVSKRVASGVPSVGQGVLLRLENGRELEKQILEHGRGQM
jgi:hypothetical protein